jgi:hypothetical protein
MRGGEYCKKCLFYEKCHDLDDDTEVFDCDLKIEGDDENEK